MSEAKPSTTRDALIAELLGDLQGAIGKLEQGIEAGNRLDKALGGSTNALIAATDKYRSLIDDMAARLRVETAAMLKTSTEHAANALVGQQTAVLQQAASSAVTKAIQDGLGSRLRKYCVIAVLVSSVLSAAIVIAALKFSA